MSSWATVIDSPTDAAALISGTLADARLPVTARAVTLAAEFDLKIDRTEVISTYVGGVIAGPGIDPTGVVECSAAIQAMLDSFATFGARAYAKGTFKTTSTLTITGNVDMADATVNYAGTGTAIRVGSTTVDVICEFVSVPKVVNTAKTVTGWAQVAGSVGVQVVNMVGCPHLSVPSVSNFAVGLLMYGQTRGCVGNTVLLGRITNNQINHKLDADATGWTNSNVFLNGMLQHLSAEGANVAGTRQILMVETVNALNNNLWLNTDIEGNTAEIHLDVAGAYNAFDNLRWEAAPCKVRWQASASRNVIRGGFSSMTIVQTHVAGSTKNHVYSAGVLNLPGAEQRLETSSSILPVVTVLEPGATVAGADPATDYAVQECAASFKFKRAADAADRLIIDAINGRTYYGQGAVAPVRYIGNYGTTSLEVNGGHLAFNADNTWDLGLAANRPRNAYIGTSIVLAGIKITYGTAAPTTGAQVAGSECKNSAPAVGQPKAWLCTVSGTPGTWVSTGNL